MYVAQSLGKGPVFQSAILHMELKGCNYVYVYMGFVEFYSKSIGTISFTIVIRTYRNFNIFNILKGGNQLPYLTEGFC